MVNEQLRVFGLTDNESRAYVALMRFGRQSPAELAPRANVSRGRVYQILGELCRKGLAIAGPGETRSFVSVEPRIALGGILQEQRTRVEQTSEVLDSLCESLASIAAPVASELPAIEILHRPDQIALRFQQLQREAQWEILAFVKLSRVAGSSNTDEFEALARGVRMAGIYERGVLDDPSHLHELRGFVEAGEEARVMDELPMKLAVFDRCRAIMPLASTHDPGLPFTPVVVHDPGLVRVLAAGFDHLWEQAEPIGWTHRTADSRQQDPATEEGAIRERR